MLSRIAIGEEIVRYNKRFFHVLQRWATLKTSRCENPQQCIVNPMTIICLRPQQTFVRSHNIAVHNDEQLVQNCNICWVKMAERNIGSAVKMWEFDRFGNYRRSTDRSWSGEHHAREQIQHGIGIEFKSGLSHKVRIRDIEATTIARLDNSRSIDMS